MCFGFGVLAGAVTVVKAIQVCLERFRVQMVCLILGMMIGSFYAIIMGPTTLSVPQLPMGLSEFSAVACVVGIALVLGLEFVKERRMRKAF